jgi:hypothetical protein
MLGLVVLFALANGPAILVWFLVDLFPVRSRLWPKIFGALCGGLFLSGMLMWDDAQEGFCCREYKATALTELWFYTLVAFVLALVFYPAVALASHVKRLWLGKSSAVVPPGETRK